uniref:Uncharacterized protein n=1 Tax=Tolypothrix bouteillei VB521301 TaxID=1479485 RepID=A0A0C1N2F2_9CYAN
MKLGMRLLRFSKITLFGIQKIKYTIIKNLAENNSVPSIQISYASTSKINARILFHKNKTIDEQFNQIYPGITAW